MNWSEFTEGRGTGIPKIIRAMSQNGSPPAEFEFDEDYSYFMVRLPVHSAALEVVESGMNGSAPGSEATQSPTQSPTQSDDPVVRLLLLLKAGAKSSGELRQTVGIKLRPTFRSNYLHPAIERGFVEYTIPEKPSSRLQQYRLTQRGWRALEATEARE